MNDRRKSGQHGNQRQKHPGHVNVKVVGFQNQWKSADKDRHDRKQHHHLANKKNLGNMNTLPQIFDEDDAD